MALLVATVFVGGAPTTGSDQPTISGGQQLGSIIWNKDWPAVKLPVDRLLRKRIPKSASLTGWKPAPPETG
jgi:hypothetical protein